MPRGWRDRLGMSAAFSDDVTQTRLPLWVVDELPERPFSSSALRRLGVAMASGGPLDETNLRIWGEFNTHYSAVEQALRADVLHRLEHDGLPIQLEVTSRFKSRPTVLAKLRSHSQLDRIRDLIGVRIVMQRGGRNGQDRIVRCLAAAYPPAKIIDRRADPRAGYRAVHLEVNVAGARAEIQVRTSLQHQWAEVCERAADRWGRDLRYGKVPPYFSAARAQAWDTLQAISELIGSWEELSAIYETAPARNRIAFAIRRPRLALRRLSVPRRLDQALKQYREGVDDVA